MSDYISREELLEKEKYLADWNIDLYYIDSDDVKMIPSADVRPNIHGHWEPKYPTREEIIYCQERYFCSNCKGYVVDRIARLEFNFCPNCGADMREPKDIIHKAIDNTTFAEESYPNIKEELHKAVVMAEPKGEKGTE